MAISWADLLCYFACILICGVAFLLNDFKLSISDAFFEGLIKISINKNQCSVFDPSYEVVFDTIHVLDLYSVKRLCIKALTVLLRCIKERPSDISGGGGYWENLVRWSFFSDPGEKVEVYFRPQLSTFSFHINSKYKLYVNMLDLGIFLGMHATREWGRFFSHGGGVGARDFFSVSWNNFSWTPSPTSFE